VPRTSSKPPKKKPAARKPAAAAAAPAPEFDPQLETLKRIRALRGDVRRIETALADNADQRKTLRADLRETTLALTREMDAETAPLFAAADRT
jgi:septal ring factor EnvC (AmiA/AmiB activator)